MKKLTNTSRQPMSVELQKRAMAWQSQPQRSAPEYRLDSHADWFIGVYASNGCVDLRGDWLDYLRSGVAERLYLAERGSGPDAAFYREAAEILKAIETEAQGTND